jgi:2-C-methyl-D-erythritol 4-phosphate cytidylyltransferase
MTAPRVHALIPAAGRSVRFGGTTLKQYAHLMGLPVMAHSIEAVMAHAAIESVTVALAQDDGIFEQLVQPLFPAVKTVAGGSSRARTVMNGLNFIAGQYSDCEWVLVHDAARPCLSLADLDRLLKEGLESDAGAILAMPVSDTLKLADDSARIERTIDRSRYWAAQTPQLFPIRLLQQQLTDALDGGVEPTDEASAIERGGFHPLLVKGSSSNIKITGAEDLALAEFVLQQQAVLE